MYHVLIIEDEPLVAMAIQDILESQGATSFEIADTQEAAVSAATAHQPDMITSDVKLLEGTGPHAVAEIHRRLGPVPVIFISGTPEECIPCNPPGSIVLKPFTAQALISAFREVGIAAI
ncbi:MULTISPECIES: response regulator [unclassified Sphingomonas]|uniref:response regulator n=1 Tax=unclassified Sphingomonas TaxID=196159 RepID=UPI002151E87F|nr:MULTISPECIES: response regulator [unclassified Sphingomonas]MCR5869508.1 response regulator [Sphingomonas sp. J344]MCR5869731.1 response regulator [Sphingomonas sp. J344]UUX98563.1 response regulator [Sphingomonas sp. J315]UUX98770.1 response regulator [Sphingomonas sp. J315]